MLIIGHKKWEQLNNSLLRNLKVGTICTTAFYKNYQGLQDKLYAINTHDVKLLQN